MKKMVIVVMAVLVAFSCSNGSNVAGPKNPLLSFGPEVLPGVYDNQRGTVYIVPGGDHPVAMNTNAVIIDIVAGKTAWETKFPGKKIVAMTQITGDWEDHKHSYVAGLLIHYTK